MDDGDVVSGPGDSTVTEFATYEEYLDSQITPLDLYYLEVPWIYQFHITVSHITSYHVHGLTRYPIINYRTLPTFTHQLIPLFKTHTHTHTHTHKKKDKELARQLVELGYRGSGEPLKREEFESRKKAAENFRLSKRLATKVFASQGKDLTGYPFLQALADREESNRSGKLTVCIPIP
jgi:hypothetical protein